MQRAGKRCDQRKYKIFKSRPRVLYHQLRRRRWVLGYVSFECVWNWPLPSVHAQPVHTRGGTSLLFIRMFYLSPLGCYASGWLLLYNSCTWSVPIFGPVSYSNRAMRKSPSQAERASFYCVCLRVQRDSAIKFVGFIG